MKSERRGFLDLAAFAAPSIPLAAFGLPLVVYLPEYYTNALGLPLAAVGAAFMLVRILDIMFDPLFGTFMDRTKFRWGRFKPWLVIGAPLVMIGAYMLFMAEKGVGIVFLWFWLIVVYVGYSICVLAHAAWGATLSQDYHERSRVYGFWQTGNVLGVILILALPVALSFMPTLNARLGGIEAMGLFIVITLPAMVALSVWKVNEPPVRRMVGEKNAGLGDYFNLFKRATVRRLLITDLLLALAPAVTGTLFFFYFERVKGFNKTEAEILLLFYFFAAIAGGPVWGWLAGKYGKTQVMIGAAVTYAVVQFAVVTLPAGNLPLAIPFLILAGLPYSAAGMLLRAMLADVGDEERLMSGVDRTGLLYAILTGTAKIGSALAVGITFFGLSALGFKGAETEVSSSLGMTGLQALYAILPGVLGLVAAWVMIGYPLTSERHTEIRMLLAERDAQEPEDDPLAALPPQVLGSTPT